MYFCNLNNRFNMKTKETLIYLVKILLDQQSQFLEIFQVNIVQLVGQQKLHIKVNNRPIKAERNV